MADPATDIANYKLLAISKLDNLVHISKADLYYLPNFGIGLYDFLVGKRNLLSVRILEKFLIERAAEYDVAITKIDGVEGGTFGTLDFNVEVEGTQQVIVLRETDKSGGNA